MTSKGRDWPNKFPPRTHESRCTLPMKESEQLNGLENFCSLFFLLKIVLAIHGNLWFHKNFRFVFSISVKNMLL